VANTVNIKGNPVKNEAAAAATLAPGVGVELDASGELVAAPGEETDNHRLYATEAPERNIAADDGSYAANEQVPFIACAPGHEVAARTAAATFTVGDIVQLSTAGLTEAFVALSVPTGVVLTTKTTTAADPLVHIRVL